MIILNSSQDKQNMLSKFVEKLEKRTRYSKWTRI